MVRRDGAAGRLGLGRFPLVDELLGRFDERVEQTALLVLGVDEQHRHFGGGQTEVELTLPPGRHTLQLVLGDHLHIPHDPPVVSQPVTITVK